MQTKQNILKIYLIILLLTISSQSASKNQLQAILQLDRQAHKEPIEDIIITKNKDIISASADKTIRIYDKNGIEKRKILGQISDIAQGIVLSIVLSNDEKYLAVGGYMDKFDSPHSGDIRIYEYLTGKLVQILKHHTSGVFDLAFSEDDKYLISGGAGGMATLWKMKNEKLVFYDNVIFHKNDVKTVGIIKKDNQYFTITAGADNKIALYDIQKRKIIKYHQKEYTLQYIAISKKNKHIAISDASKNIFIYDFNLKLTKTISNKGVSLGLDYSPNGELLITGSYNPLDDLDAPNIVNIYQSSKNYSLKTSFKKHNYVTTMVAFIDNETAISAQSYNNEMYIWNINSLKIKNKIKGVGDFVFSVGIKGNNIAWGNINTCPKCQIIGNKLEKLTKSINLKTFNISNGPKKNNYTRISTINNHYSLKHTKNEKYGVMDGKLQVKYKNKIKSEIEKGLDDGFNHSTYGWYKDYIISGGAGGKLLVYNKKGDKIASLLGHKRHITSLALEGDRLISGSYDQTIKIWDLSKIEKETKIYPTISLFISNDNEYIAWNNKGFFNASKKGAKYMGYHINQGADKEAIFLSMDKLNSFYRPDLIAKVLKGESLEAYAKDINIKKIIKTNPLFRSGTSR